MFHKIPEGSKIIGEKYGKLVWETPDNYKLLVANSDADPDPISRYNLGSRLDLKSDFIPGKDSQIIELTPPGARYDLELDSIVPPNIGNNQEKMLAFRNDVADNVSVGDIGTGSDIEVKYKYPDGRPNANIDNLSDEVRNTFGAIVNVWKDNNAPTPVITSGNDSRHDADSLHYEDNAIDIRGNNISDEKGRKMAQDLRTILGNDYDVLFEQPSDDPAEDHIHIEYQPKNKK